MNSRIFPVNVLAVESTLLMVIKATFVRSPEPSMIGTWMVAFCKASNLGSIEELGMKLDCGMRSPNDRI
jgi:hypothetical protein